jgi:ABC-2 type transport system permease protein
VTGAPRYGTRGIWTSLRLSLLTFVADPQWIIPSSIAPVIFAFASFEMFRGSGPTLVLYAVLGASTMSMWGQTLYGSGWATGMDRFLGTLEPTLAAPTPYFYVVAGRVIWNVLTGLVGGALVLGVVLWAYGQPLPLSNGLLFLGLFLVLMGSLAAVGLLFTTLFVYTRFSGFIQNVGEFSFYIISGAMFPVILLPFWTSPVSLAFPATWAVDALRYVGVPGYRGLPWGLTGDLLGTLGTSLAYLAVAVGAFRWVERHLLEAGTAGDY